MREILYNPDNLKKEDIDEVVVRVKALMINSNNEITLGYAHKTYQFPGGHIEQGETLEEGLIRAIKEETGIKLNGNIPSPFQKTTYYTKNYRDSGLNRENDIYYYVIETDQVFDMSNTCLDQHEIDGNYTYERKALDCLFYYILILCVHLLFKSALAVVLTLQRRERIPNFIALHESMYALSLGFFFLRFLTNPYPCSILTFKKELVIDFITVSFHFVISILSAFIT